MSRSHSTRFRYPRGGRSQLAPILARLARLAGLSLLLACEGPSPGDPDETAPASDPQAHADRAEQAAANDTKPDVTEAKAAAQAEANALDREFPLHGLVTGVQLRVKSEPDPDAKTLGWLRIGTRIRAAEKAVKTSTCATGWHRISPDGWACAGRGIALAKTPPPETVPAANRAAALPYTYYFVKEPKVPEYHRLPSRDEQQRAQAFLDSYFALKEEDEERAAKFYRGELPDQPQAPRVVRRFLDRGFFLAGAGRDDVKGRRFVLTTRGAYVQEARLQQRTGSDFRGVEINAERPLPVAWAVRTAQPFVVRPRDDGSVAMIADDAVPAYERHQLLPWVGFERIGQRVFHKLDGQGLKGERYLKHWFAAVAERVERPRRVGANEPWVHINLAQQTLVLYQGDEPVYATLVSSGLEGHETPTGLFTIRRKYVTDSMSDIGPEVSEDQRYSIEDVPWTQYFDGSIALHGAFWHDRFGLQRSHGCVNLAPEDARRVFDHTWPPVTDGWHGISVENTGQVASQVWVTEE